MTIQRLSNLNADSRAQKRVAIIGDVILDHYLFGRYDRPSPEANVPVIEHMDQFYKLGGAANVAKNIKSLGATPILFSVIGNDHYADMVFDLMIKNDISYQHTIKEPAYNTVCKTRLFVDNSHHLRYDREPSAKIVDSILDKLFEDLSSYIRKNSVDIILLQDYNKGVLTATFIKRIIDLAQTENIPIIVDPKKDNFRTFKGISLFKPNLREVQDALNVKIDTAPLDLAALNEHATFLRETMNLENLIITLGEEGIYYNSGTDVGIIPALETDVKDVCGAGDAVVSTCALLMCFGFTLMEMAEVCNKVGSIVCSQLGVVAIQWDEIVKI